ncbi:hypothetical protein [Anabaena sp. CS-542/02]|uniref:hypothetical protein n=1 Tax=Anabaena sp. CS-542/02 TaxID=3021719 RepID=UPI00232D15B5|nr:hypothetical protein [Anabaena sp. CS-542/02]
MNIPQARLLGKFRTLTTVSVNTVTFSQIDNLIFPTQAIFRLSFCALMLFWF